MKRLIATSLLLASLAVHADNMDRDAKAIQALASATAVLAASDLSCATSADCLALPIGSRACGGPSDYVIASKKNGNLNEVKYLAQRTTKKEEAFNQTYEVASICAIEPQPQAKCIAKLCK